jgi:hypothetical protein
MNRLFAFFAGMKVDQLPLQALFFSRAKSSILVLTVDGILYRYTTGAGIGSRYSNWLQPRRVRVRSPVEARRFYHIRPDGHWGKLCLLYQWRTQEFCWGGLRNSVEDRRQRERGSGDGSPLVRSSIKFTNE